MKMTLDEFTDIIDRHGVDKSQWPPAKRELCLEFVASNADARTLLNRQRQVDTLLDQFSVPQLTGLEARVLNQTLPPRELGIIDRMLQWLLPENAIAKQFWRPAMAACLPLVFGIVLGNYFSFGVGAESPGFEYWDDELYMLSLNDYTENLF